MTTDMIIAAARAELAALQLRRLLTSTTAQDAEARRLERELERSKLPLRVQGGGGQ